MSVHKANIIEAATGDEVVVELHDDLSLDGLLDVEDQWAEHRRQLRAMLKRSHIRRELWPQSLHWDWGRKALRLEIDGEDDFRIMAVRRETSWEAAMITLGSNHFSSLSTDVGAPLIYVDYLEVAPWNWTIEGIQNRKFKAAGSALLHASIEQSFAKGWSGRIGLHALPQAAAFYSSVGMQFVRNDPRKQNLPYFELSAAEALKRRASQ